MPYELASWMLGQWCGLSVSSLSLWNWGQGMGNKAQQMLEIQLEAQASDAQAPCDAMSGMLSALPLAIAADVVMVPFPKTPKGKTQWREVKVAILARLGTWGKMAQKSVLQLLCRRLVAVLGDIDQFIPALQLEAHKQDFESAPIVIWLSDGGRGFLTKCLSGCYLFSDSKTAELRCPMKLQQGFLRI